RVIDDRMLIADPRVLGARRKRTRSPIDVSLRSSALTADTQRRKEWVLRQDRPASKAVRCDGVVGEGAGGPRPADFDCLERVRACASKRRDVNAAAHRTIAP